MLYYQIRFHDPEKGRSHCGFIACEHPQTQDSLIKMLIMDGFELSLSDMYRQYQDHDFLTEEEAETLFSAGKNTVRRRTNSGDFFVKPQDSVPAVVVVEGASQEKNIIMLRVPSCVVMDDCNGNALRRLLNDAVMVHTGSKTASWSDFVKCPREVLEKFGVSVDCGGGTFLTVTGHADEAISENNILRGYAVIHQETANMIDRFLTNEEHQGEDNTVSTTIVFADGMQMDIKCCGCKDPDESSWTEAVLFNPNGSEVCCTDVEEEYLGDWELECGGKTYIGHVYVEGKSPHQIREKAYRKYQLDWMASHGFSVHDLVNEVVQFAIDNRECDPAHPECDDISALNSREMVDEWVADSGFSGSLWVCFDEFLGAEYRDIEYMRHLLTPDEFEDYFADING